MGSSSRASSSTGSHHISSSFNGQDAAVSRSRQPPSTVQAQGLGCAHPAAAAAGYRSFHDHPANYPPDWTSRQPVPAQVTWCSPSVHPTFLERVQCQIAPSRALIQPSSFTFVHGTWAAGLGAGTPPVPSVEGVQGQTYQPSSPIVKAGAWRGKLAAGVRTASKTDCFDIQNACDFPCIIACGEHQEFNLLSPQSSGKKQTMCSSSAVEENIESQNCGAQKLVKKVAELEMLIKEMEQEKKIMEKLHKMDMRARDKKEI